MRARRIADDRSGASMTRRPSGKAPDPSTPGGTIAVAGDGERDREVGRRLGDPHPADRREVDVGGAQLHPGPPVEHRQHHRDPAGLQPGRRPTRVGRLRAGHQRLNLDDQWATALERDRDAGAGHGAGAF